MLRKNKPDSKNRKIDNEWEEFMSHSKYEEDEEELGDNADPMLDSEDMDAVDLLHTRPDAGADAGGTKERPIISDIYISTKTKIAFLNRPLDLKEIFWKIPVMEYARAENGVIKKQMKFNSLSETELEEIQDHLKTEHYYEEYVMTSINNPKGRIKFKDIRKVTVGISKKDLTSYRCKKKSAFYNCFVVILRIKFGGTFKEFHVKVFNTGKMEIPGVQTHDSYKVICDMMVDLLNKYVDPDLQLIQDKAKCETILINSNFNAGFYINRELFYDILQTKYNIQCIYDPCSYPGIQCKIYYNAKQGIMKSRDKEKETVEISFMIFRTGSVLIVGKCDDDVLQIVYEYLRDILYTEYETIGKLILQAEKDEIFQNKNKKKKVRRKDVYFDADAPDPLTCTTNL